MSPVVADASFCGAWILPDEASPVAEDFLREILHGAMEMRVPSLWHYEMANLLRSAHRQRRLSRTALFAAERALAKVPIRVMDVPDSPTRARILELSLAHDLSAYDAAYIELALRFKIPLHTTDGKLRKIAKTWR